MNTLEQLSREELIALGRRQAQQIAELQLEIQTLRDLLQGRGPGNALPPFVKPNRKQRAPGEKKERKKRAQAFVRPRQEPTREIPHAVQHCPDCGRQLEGGWEHSRHQVIEIPYTPVEIIDHVLVRRRCGVCNTSHLPRLEPQDGVIGQHRVGPRLMSLVATLCTDYRVPRESVQRLLQSVYQVHLSAGEISEILHTVARQGKEAVAAILAEVRAAPFVHGDETSWREDGLNGYLWSFSTPTTRYFYRDQSRGAKVARGILLGQWEQEDGTLWQEECRPFTGVLICDFYCGYSWYELLQRCWDHLCRELKELQKKHAQQTSVTKWVEGVFKVYARAKQVAAAGYSQAKRRQWRQRLLDRLLALAKPYAQDKNAPQQELAARIERFQAELLVFIEYPGMPSGNNAAERAIRPAVIARKVSGGTRSKKGSETMAALRTLFGTWLLRGRDTLEACFLLLTGATAPARAAPFCPSSHTS